MIEEGIIAIMLIWLIGEVQYIKHRLKKGAEVMEYYNHKITAIERTLQRCGIVLLDDPGPETQITPPPLGPDLE